MITTINLSYIIKLKYKSTNPIGYHDLKGHFLTRKFLLLTAIYKMFKIQNKPFFEGPLLRSGGLQYIAVGYVVGYLSQIFAHF